jgi:phosphatidylglycerol---prolipoprotein diacylglyceryl transferase
VLFYQPAWFAAHPGQILAVWQGGMSFHGGLLGVAAGILGFSLRNGYPMWRIGDAVSAAAPIGLFFGRLANFINVELWGRPSTVPWAVAFPGEAAETCPPDWQGVCARHPSQLYEAGLEGIVLFAVLALAIRGGALARPGRVFGLFLVGYALARMFVERFRQADLQYVTPDNPAGHVLRFGDGWGLTMGQTLSLPMLVFGVALLLWSGRRR